MQAEWIKKMIVSGARSLSENRAAIHRFEEKVVTLLEKTPIQDWEADRILRGLKRKFIRMEEYFFRVGTGKRGPLSLFVRNDAGLNVGLRREAITQMATFVSLITDYSFPREFVRFETGWMDVVVFDAKNQVLIYAENKASDRTLEKLLLRLEIEFALSVPIIREDDMSQRHHDDAVMKANHIWRNRPAYFFGRAPGVSRAYLIHYGDSGFSLERIETLPSFDQLIHHFQPAPLFV